MASSYFTISVAISPFVIVFFVPVFFMLASVMTGDFNIRTYWFFCHLFAATLTPTPSQPAQLLFILKTLSIPRQAAAARSSFVFAHGTSSSGAGVLPATVARSHATSARALAATGERLVAAMRAGVQL